MPIERLLYYFFILVAIVLVGWFALEIIDKVVDDADTASMILWEGLP